MGHKPYTEDDLPPPLRAWFTAGLPTTMLPPEARTAGERAMEEAKAKHEEGEEYAVLVALNICCEYDLKIPVWARKAFMLAYRSPLKSWDDAFGPPVPKGKSVDAIKRRLELALSVIQEVRSLHHSGRPIDVGLFETVGEKFDLSASTVSSYYYDKHARASYVRWWALQKVQQWALAELGPDASEAAQKEWILRNRQRVEDLVKANSDF